MQQPVTHTCLGKRHWSQKVHERLTFQPPNASRYIANQNTKNETNDKILQGKKATVMYINTELCSLHGTVLSELVLSSILNTIPDF